MARKGGGTRGGGLAESLCLCILLLLRDVCSVPVCVHVCACVWTCVGSVVCVCACKWLLYLPPGWMLHCLPANAVACVISQRAPFWGIKEIGGQLLFGTRLDSKWHPREKFQPLILATQELHWIKCFLYFHNFYIYMSFSILYSWVIQDKQIELPII